MPVRPFVILLVAAVAAGCSSSDEGALVPSTFTLRVDGGSSQTYAGSAHFSHDAFSGEPMFGIALGAPMGTPEVGPYMTFIRFGAPPRPGRYPLADFAAPTGAPNPDEFFGLYFDPGGAFDRGRGPEPGGALPGFYYARTGTLTIDRIEASDAVEGRFAMTVQSFRVTGFDPEDPDGSPGGLEPVGEPVEVAGEFNASFRSGLFNDAPPVGAPLASFR